MKPEVLVFFGLIASGKSTLAERVARELDWPWLNTDRVRKELAGIEPGQRCYHGHGQGLYSPAMTARTYQALLERGERALAAGSGLVLDGSYSRASDRDRVGLWAGEHRVGIRFILCHCSEEETRRRLEKRARDPNAVSDGRWDIYIRQRQSFEDPRELSPGRLLILDTDRDSTALVQEIMAWLNGPGEERNRQ